MIIYVDVLTEKDVCSDSYEFKEFAEGSVRGFESKKVSESGVVLNIGANASAEADAEEEDDDVETFINIVKAHQLQSIPLEKKEFKAYMKSYWKALLKKLNSNIYKMAGLSMDDVSKDKKEAAAELQEAIDELSKYDIKAVDDAKAQLASFRANFEHLQNWVKKDILKNFDDFEFYIPEAATLGECIIIPAQYLGESETPTFMIVLDGTISQKE